MELDKEEQKEKINKKKLLTGEVTEKVKFLLIYKNCIRIPQFNKSQNLILFW
jgi:hypothetical protein